MRRRKPRPVVSMAGVADGAILLDQTTGAFYHLNPTAALVYQLLSTHELTLEETADVLASTFHVDAAAVRGDLRTFVEALVRRGLLRP